MNNFSGRKIFFNHHDRDRM